MVSKTFKSWAYLSKEREKLVEEVQAEGYTFDEFATAETLIKAQDSSLWDMQIDICVEVQRDLAGHTRVLNPYRKEEILLLANRLKELD